MKAIHPHMDTVQLQKQTAKQLFKNKQFKECKKVLLDIVQEVNDYKSLMRLGNTCTELGEYENAKKYYQQAINENPKYPASYSRFGILLDILNEKKFAETMFEISVKLDPKNNDLLWFNYGKLMYKVRNFDKAKQCFLKCIRETAGLHYHFAKLILTIANNNISTIQKAKLKLEKATQIKPNIAKYHYEYALCLAKVKEYNTANAQFLLALQLKTTTDLKINILYDFAELLTSHFSNRSSALKYLKIAVELDIKKEFTKVQSRCNDLKKWFEQSSKYAQKTEANDLKTVTEIKYDSQIRLLVYSFDENITYWAMNHLNIDQLRNMSRLDCSIKIFGGTDRINRLQQHFQRLLTSKNNIKIAIVSVENSTENMVYALKKVNLYKSLVNAAVITAEYEPYITALAETYAYDIETEILFIDSVSENIQSLQKKCKTYQTGTQPLINGLSLKSMYQIEKMLAVSAKGVNNRFDDFDIDTKCADIREIEPRIYDSIKREIIKKPYIDSIYSLPVIQHIKQTWDDGSDKEHFLYFAYQFKLIRRCKPKAHFWKASNFLPQLMKLSPNDSEFPGRYASSMAFLQQYTAADKYFQLAITHQPIAINYHQYAYFLFDRKKYKKAETHFLKAIELSNVWYYSRSCMGYARNLEHLDQPRKAEYYYKEAVKCKYQRGKMQYFYGIFLYNNRRYFDAKKQFEIAVDYFPSSATNHYWLSKTLIELGQFANANYHSKEAFKLDPSFGDTATEFRKYKLDTAKKENEKCEINSGNENEQMPKEVTVKKPANPLLHFSEDFEGQNMEKYRKQMEILARNEFEICLDQLNETYFHYFGRALRTVYSGRMKNLGMYFNDLFWLKWCPEINQVYLVSKVYNKSNPKSETVLNETRKENIDFNAYKAPNPLLKGFSEPIDAMKMETYRGEMKMLAQNEARIVLDQLHLIYLKYFNRRFKNVYQGKAKNLVMYYSDLWDLEWNANTQCTNMISKVYAPHTYTMYKHNIRAKWTKKEKFSQSYQPKIK